MTRRIRAYKRTLLAVAAGSTLVAAQALAGVTAHAAPARNAAPAAHGVNPRAVGELDCNGYSPIQRPVKRNMSCTDIRGFEHGERFYDNGHYIGHDEPSIRFLSSRPGSGGDVTFTETLPRGPSAKLTTNNPGHDVTQWFELTPAPWFGMSLCDPNSYPQRKCTPNSDTNAPHGAFPGGGAAFMEMQFYPPGFSTGISCNSNSQWCAALNIDSLEGSAAGNLNFNCTEPVNFAYIQRNGVPAGPPSPQLSDSATFTPNSETLLMNPGDVVRTHMFDANIGNGQHAFEVTIDDLTTGQSGFMAASANNGFMNTSIFDCSGHPFNFQPLFNTAMPQNSTGWSVLLSGILTEYEIGHFTPCSHLTGQVGSGANKFFLNCKGAYEDAGPPDGGPGSQELSDAPCYYEGFSAGGTVPPDKVTGCLDAFTQNGDLDFDGTSYWPDYPNSLKPGPFPTPILQQQPTTSGGARYAKIQFETDAPASEINTCAPDTPQGCAVPPPNSPGHFYPYYTQARVGGQCVWEFGNMSNGNTFGGDRQYASLVEHGFFKGQFDLASKPLPNPMC
jgi:hypothetical protein